MSALTCQYLDIAWRRKHSGISDQWLVAIIILLGDALTYPSLQSLLFHYNVQHDCYQGSCQASGVHQLKQERILSRKTENFIQHNVSIDTYIINLHALHNTHLLWTVLPWELVQPLPFASDCISHHCQVLLVLQEKIATKKKRRNLPDGSSQAGPSAKRSKVTGSGLTSGEDGGRMEMFEGHGTMVNDDVDKGLEYIWIASSSWTYVIW